MQSPNNHPLRIIAIALLLSALSAAPLAVRQALALDDSGGEVLTRGPIHEAFAQPADVDATKAAIREKKPPADIDEIPPDQKPDGENVIWIPGYWEWDTDRDDYIWISGIWRDAPSGRTWVPGNWEAVDGGYSWTPGFWASSVTQNVEYVPEPPASLEEGPLVSRPSTNSIWATGSWGWRGLNFSWRPGYWEDGREDLLWVPAHYVWTPRGYIYVEGYWDYDLDSRGVLFAPVYFEPTYYRRPHYRYTPSCVIDTRYLTTCLFIGPRSRHYCFGDYYGDRYVSRGYRPWFRADEHHHYYDPIYAHRRWREERHDSHWAENIRNDYDYRRNHVDSRPPRTFAQQQQYRQTAAARPNEHNNNDNDRHARPFLAASYKDYAARHNEGTRKYNQVSETDRQALAQRGRELAKFRQNIKETPNRAKYNPKDNNRGTATTNRNNPNETSRGGNPNSPIIQHGTNDNPRRADNRNDNRTERGTILDRAHTERNDKNHPAVVPNVRDRVRDGVKETPRATEPGRVTLPERHETERHDTPTRHETPGVIVEPNVKLPSHGNDRGRDSNAGHKPLDIRESHPITTPRSEKPKVETPRVESPRAKESTGRPHEAIQERIERAKELPRTPIPSVKPRENDRHSPISTTPRDVLPKKPQRIETPKTPPARIEAPIEHMAPKAEPHDPVTITPAPILPGRSGETHGRSVQTPHVTPTNPHISTSPNNAHVTAPVRPSDIPPNNELNKGNHNRR